MAGDELKMMMEMKSDIASIKGILSTMANTNEVAIKALDSAQSAHHRINELRKNVDDLGKEGSWLPKIVTAAFISSGVGGIIGFVVTKMFS